MTRQAGLKGSAKWRGRLAPDEGVVVAKPDELTLRRELPSRRQLNHG